MQIHIQRDRNTDTITDIEINEDINKHRVRSSRDLGVGMNICRNTKLDKDTDIDIVIDVVIDRYIQKYIYIEI